MDLQAGNPSPENLFTENLRLSLLDIERDIADLHVACADPLVMARWLEQPPSSGPDETRARLATRLGLTGAAMWSVRRTGDETVLGLVERVGDTTPPGLGWMLRRDAWAQGIMGEAAPAVVAHLLGPGGLDRVEAWADSTNVASLKVARRCGLTERGRIPRREGETVVLGRTNNEEPQELYGTDPVLPVRDVTATLDLVCQALGLRPGFRYGEPISYAGVRAGPWSSSRGFHLAAVGEDQPINPVTLYVHCGAPVADLHARAGATGAQLAGPPRSMPWGRTEFTLQLPEGHRLIVSGPA